jgi:uncharacterized protein (TIGR00106 family)
MSVLLEFSMFPTDRGESLSAYVSPIVAMIRDSGAAYRLTPMGTVVETATLGEALALVERAYGLLEAAGCRRVYSALKLDIRAGQEGRLEAKIASVRGRIGALDD